MIAIRGYYDITWGYTTTTYCVGVVQNLFNDLTSCGKSGFLAAALTLSGQWFLMPLLEWFFVFSCCLYFERQVVSDALTLSGKSISKPLHWMVFYNLLPLLWVASSLSCSYFEWSFILAAALILSGKWFLMPLLWVAKVFLKPLHWMVFYYLLPLLWVASSFWSKHGFCICYTE